MYFAQVVEAGIKNALVMAQLTSREHATMDDFDEAWTLNFKVTMGKLVHRFKLFLGGDDSLGEDLRLALDIRNQLAHHFFWDHAVDATTFEGRDRMIAECMAAVDLFQDVEERLSVVVRRYSEAVGTPPAVFVARLDESLDELRSDSARRSPNTCGRCVTSMEAAGDERRRYWKCPKCGSIALA